MKFFSFLLVFLGGGLGSMLRYALSKINNNEHIFAFGTLLANVLGAFLIGLILGFSAKNNWLSTSATLLLSTGFCGGFTTFSTFAYENTMLLKSGNFMAFILYSSISFIFGITAVYAGLWLSKA